jgi:hypothetical protein
MQSYNAGMQVVALVSPLGQSHPEYFVVLHTIHY